MKSFFHLNSYQICIIMSRRRLSLKQTYVKKIAFDNLSQIVYFWFDNEVQYAVFYLFHYFPLGVLPNGKKKAVLCLQESTTMSS